MSNHLHPKLFWVSLLIHVFIFLFIDISYRNSHIQRLFVAYGSHSRHVSHAYFREMKSPGNNYRKYVSGKTKLRQGTVSKSEKKLLAKNVVKKQTVAKAAKKIKKISTGVTVEKFVKKKEKPLQKPKVKQKVVKPEPEEVKKEEKVEEVKNDVEVKKEEVKKPEEIKKEEEEVSEEVGDEPEFLHFNLMGESDPKVLVYQQHIQEEVDRLWRPPLGVPKGTECIATFEVDRNGAVKSFNIEKKSKMLIYDLSIIRVGKLFKFNECLWGKSFTINFRQ